ncbi:MAG: BofC C-terminal domain-containing protein [Mobilitalea sp.]
MKLKSATIYLTSFLILCIMFSACYYMSYLHALNDFNKSAIERKELIALTENANPTPVLGEKVDESVSVAQSDLIQAELIVRPDTEYTLEIYNMKTDTLETQVLNPPAYLVGLTREDIKDYISEYMSDLPLSEYNKGLISYELLYFSDKEIGIKKTYNEDFVPFRFYVVVKDGYVVVFNSDLKSVYSYTHIEAKTLPEEDRIALSQGIYVNNLDELYALLESYSS